MPDASAGPTFPYNGPFNPPTGSSSSSSTAEAAITLEGTIPTTLKTGDELSLNVNIDTFKNDVKSYKIVITYDSSILSVVDQNSDQSGVQVNHIDSIFPTRENTVTAGGNQGKITLSGEADAPSDFSRRVAEVKFKVEKEGSSTVVIVKAESNVLTNDEQNILVDTNSRNIIIAQQSSSSSSSSISSSSSSISSSASTTTTIASSSSSTLPDSGLFDSTSIAIPALTGVLLIYMGSLAIARKNKKKLSPKDEL